MHEGDRFARLDDWDLLSMVSEKGADSTPALTEIYLRYYSKIRNFCGRALGDWHLAEDAAQKVFQVFTGPAKKTFCRGPAKFSSLLYGIARNKVRELRREIAKRGPELDETKVVGSSQWEMTDRFYERALQELGELGNRREKKPMDCLAFHLAVCRRRWANVEGTQRARMPQEGPVFTGPSVFRRYQWLRLWSGEEKNCVTPSS